MAEKSIVIIGAGLAGLSAGCYARMNGYASHILEHHAKPGGVVASWKRKDFIFDGGVHFWMGRDKRTATGRLYDELGINRSCRFVPMDLYMDFLEESTGRHLRVTPDVQLLARDLKSISPSDGRMIDELIAGVESLRGRDLTGGAYATPVELMGIWDKIKMMFGSWSLLKFMTGRYNRPVAEFAASAQDPWLSFILQYMFLPEVPLWFLLMILALLADGNLELLDGASTDVVNTVEYRYKELGGSVAYKTTVEKIIVEHNRAVGVRTASGEEYRADVVISAADGYSTIYRMLDGRFTDRTIDDQYKNSPLLTPTVMINYGISRELADRPWLSLLKLEKPIRLGPDEINGFSIRIFNYSSRLAPAGKTVVQCMLDSQWDWWAELRNDMPRYKAEKERIAAEVAQRLEKFIPGFAQTIEVTDVATPYTTWRYTLNHRGAYMGWLPTPEMLRTKPLRTLPGLGNFYMAGQWAMPGGGVPTVLFSGRHVIQIIAARDARRFQTEPAS